MTKLADHVGAVQRYLLGSADYSPRLEHVVRRIADGWVYQVEQGKKAAKERELDADARAVQIRNMVDAEMTGPKAAKTRTAARKRVADVEGISLPRIKKHDLRGARVAAKRRTRTPANTD